MPNKLLRGAYGLLMLLGAGCGGFSNSFTSPTVSVTFASGAPAGAAVQIGTEPFVSVSLAGNELRFTLPSATTKYSVVYLCANSATFPTGGAHEFVIQATGHDGTLFTVSCPQPYLASPTLGSAAGSADATLIPGAAQILIQGKGIWVVDATANPGSFDVNLPVGTYDVAAVATDQNGWPLAVKMLQSQTVPGSLNGGLPVVFQPGDAVTNQPVAVMNRPLGFAGPLEVAVSYYTANGTGIKLNTYGPSQISYSTTQYAAVPPGESGFGDFYVFSASQNSFSGSNIGAKATTSTGGAATIVLPDVWPCSGLTVGSSWFTFNYSGFSNRPTVSLEATIIWPIGPQGLLQDYYYMTVSTTTNFLDGSSTITFPSINGAGATSYPPLFDPPPNTPTIWDARIYGGTSQQFMGSPFVDSGVIGSVSFVELDSSCN